MKQLIALITLVLLCWSPAQAQDKKKPIKIVYHYHSFYEIHTSKGTRIIIDPHAIEGYGPPKKVEGDIVLMTHSHNDHTQTKVVTNLAKLPKENIIAAFTGSGLKAKCKIIDTTIKDVKIKTMATYHDEEEGLKYGVNSVFILEFDGWRLVHLGDLGHLLSAKQIKELGKVDVLMVPVGGIYSLNGSQAYRLCQKVEPKEYIFPMHYGTSFVSDTLGPDEFLENFQAKYVAKTKDNNILLNRDPLRPRPLVVMLLAEDKK